MSRSKRKMPKNATINKEKHNNVKADSSFWNRFEWNKAKSMAICTLFCFINMALHEQTLRMAPKSAQFISFVQHLFITACGLLTLGLPFNLGSYKADVPTIFYIPIMLFSFFAILTNNLSLNYGVSMPLNMIFKSSSLVANMLLGMIFLRHRYSWKKFLSIIFITLGLIICTVEDYRVKHSLCFEDIFHAMFNPFGSKMFDNNNNDTNDTVVLNDNNNNDDDNDGSRFQTILGIIMLTLSFLLSAAIGIYQEYLSRNFKKNAHEMLYYVHLLALPIFLLSSMEDIRMQFNNFFAGFIFNDDDDVVVMKPKNPLLTFNLILLILIQYLCVRSIYKLSMQCTSLTVTLCLTNRKFLSLLFSIFYFGNLFTIWHWFGTFIVFGGTLCFYLIDALPFNNDNKKKDDNDNEQKNGKQIQPAEGYQKLDSSSNESSRSNNNVKINKRRSSSMATTTDNHNSKKQR